MKSILQTLALFIIALSSTISYAEESLGTLAIPLHRRNELLCSISHYPNEVIVQILHASQHPDYLLSGEIHPIDESFNNAMKELQQYPSLLTSMQNHPAAVAVVGRAALADIGSVWETINQCRGLPGQPGEAETQNTMVNLQNHETQKIVYYPAPRPEINYHQIVRPYTGNAEEIRQEINEIENELAQANENFEDYNENIDDFNENVDEMQQGVQKAEEKAQQRNENFQQRVAELRQRFETRAQEKTIDASNGAERSARIRSQESRIKEMIAVRRNAAARESFNRPNLEAAFNRANLGNQGFRQRIQQGNIAASQGFSAIDRNIIQGAAERSFNRSGWQDRARPDRGKRAGGGVRPSN